ncbi:PDZ domain-containing protein [Candidatus Woesearchaeota archaeon]|nr:PDZ domain-containing protein [Candidatus Woesearchaeota archaeon]
MTFTSFFSEYKWVILFYSAIILLIYLNREKFEIQAKIFALYRTKKGIKAIEKFSLKYKEFVKLFGYTGIGIGFIGMILIFITILNGLFKLFFQPSAPAVITPVLPGIKIPGSPIFLPLFYGIAALFIVVVVHEFAHGIVAASHNLKIKSTGMLFLGPIIGAFVEPDEKEVKKQSDIVQYSIFAAGPFSNIATGLLVLLLLLFVFFPAQGAMSNEFGVSFLEVQNDTPAQKAGLYPNMTIIKADNVDVNNLKDFITYLEPIKPNQTIILYDNNENNYTLITTNHPEDEKKGYLGVIGIHTKSELKSDSIFFKLLNNFISVITTLFQWVFVLSIGIGLANLLPLGPVDGGRMLQIAAVKITGSKKRGNEIWRKTSTFTMMAILLLIFVPIFKAVFGL